MRGLFRRRKCGLPPKIEPSWEELSIVRLPPKDRVEARIDEVIRDEDVRAIVKDLLAAIYRLRPDSEFMWWLKTNAIRYRLYDKPDKMVDFTAAMTLAFVDWCAKQVYGGDVKAVAFGKARLQDIKEPECRVIALIFEEVKGQYAASGMPRRKVISIAFKWKKETNSLVKLWDQIERNWCKW